MLGAGLFLLLLVSDASAVVTPPCAPALILERSTNRNRVWYQIERDAAGAPRIESRWEMLEKGADRWEKLTSTEERKIYGARVARSADGKAEFFLVGVPQTRFEISYDARGCGQLTFHDTDRRLMVTRAFARIGGLFPRVKEVRLFGRNLADRSAVSLVLADGNPSTRK